GEPEECAMYDLPEADSPLDVRFKAVDTQGFMLAPRRLFCAVAHRLFVALAAGNDQVPRLCQVDGKLDGGSPATHLAVVGAKGGMGDLSVGTRVNGLFVGMVDGGTYMTNWYYTPGMSALQVSNAITYTGGSGPVSFGVQAFDIAKGGDNTTNYTVAGTYATGGLKFGLGYTSYSDYAVIDSNGTIAQYGFSTDTNQFAESTNSYDGVTLKSVTGISAAYTADKFSVTAAYDVRKPTDNYNADDIKTAMLTGTYSVSPKTTLAANYSNTSGATKGSIITAMVSYAPSDDEKAVTNGLTGATAVGNKSVTGFAAGVIYNF
ncbi:MAG: hypothetical protein P8Z67_14180, partial [Gammaproteobacteria bacterium]